MADHAQQDFQMKRDRAQSREVLERQLYDASEQKDIALVNQAKAYQEYDEP